jgi:hypothetical protein
VKPVSVLTPAGEQPGTYVTEGALATYAFEFIDPGTRDPHIMTIRWGDGEEQTVNVAPGSRRLEVRHRYVRDGSFGIWAKVADDDSTWETSVSTLVHDVPPVVSAQLERTTIKRRGLARIAGTVADPGEHDTLTVTVDWGSGDTQTITLPPGQRTFTAEKKFVSPVAVTAKVQVHDDWRAGNSVSLPFTVV